MASGFANPADFHPVIGWELYQVTLNKYHVMFFFEDGWQLLNVAHAFSHRSQDGEVDYTYEIYGTHKSLELERLLRLRVVDVKIAAPDRLTLLFENGDELIVHDDPESCSWWFMPVDNPDDPNHKLGWSMLDADSAIE